VTENHVFPVSLAGEHSLEHTCAFQSSVILLYAGVFRLKSLMQPQMKCRSFIFSSVNLLFIGDSMLNSDEILESFKRDVVKALQNNLVCLLHHGSRAKGEARADSDYDSVIIVKQMNKHVIKILKDVFSKYPQFSFYLLSLDDLETMPKSHYLEFLYSKPLYGSLELKSPTREDVINYINHRRRDLLAVIRHELILPHSDERKIRRVYLVLKDVYICLSYLAFSECGILPSTRKQTIAYYTKQKRHSLGIHLLKILDNWDSYKEDVIKNPDSYLLLLEEFFRKFHHG